MYRCAVVELKRPVGPPVERQQQRRLVRPIEPVAAHARAVLQVELGRDDARTGHQRHLSDDGRRTDLHHARRGRGQVERAEALLEGAQREDAQRLVGQQQPLAAVDDVLCPGVVVNQVQPRQPPAEALLISQRPVVGAPGHEDSRWPRRVGGHAIDRCDDGL